MSLTFGTDGVRGVANKELTPEFALSLGRAVSRVLAPSGKSFLIGRDTRVSGPLLQAAMSAGLIAEGTDVIDLGVIPTPGIASQSVERNAAAAVISASHNPFTDNGIKVFAAGGRKLSDDVETALEAELEAITSGNAPAQSGPDNIGSLFFEEDSWIHYGETLLRCLEGRTLDKFNVVLDCANGAASRVAPFVFESAGAHVTALSNSPDGRNINYGCGSTHPETLQSEVVKRNADAGFAFDGDADRVIAVDHTGNIVDGDQMMAMCALDLRDRKKLVDDTVVVTVMTNLGFRRAMDSAGVKVIETKVGDRYVLEALEEGGYSFGGEQSGHIIFRDLVTTGDGVLTSLKIADLVRRRGATLSELAAESMTRLPQVLINMKVEQPQRLVATDLVQQELKKVDEEFQGAGRVLLRASGTEPVVRVMVEANSEDEAQKAATRLCNVLERELAQSKS